MLKTDFRNAVRPFQTLALLINISSYLIMFSLFFCLLYYHLTSLFTNILLEETIHLTTNLLWRLVEKIYKSLQVCFQFATSQTNFLFNGNMYDQVDEVAMGSPLAPILANIFMGYHENEWIRNYNYGGLFYYKRYVDDIFAVFELKIMLFHFTIISVGNTGI